MDIDSISVIDGWFPTVLVVLTIVSLLASLGWRSTRTRRRRGGVTTSDEWSAPEMRRRAAWRWQLVLGIPIALALVALAALVDDGVSLIPYQFPNSFYAWFAVIPLALAFCAIGWRGAPWWRRAISVISVVLACVFAFTFVNQHYQYYPNIGALLGKDAQYQVSDAQLKQAQADFRKTKKLPDHGFTISEHIPGIESKFNARDAFIWVPPAWVASPTPKLPVIELLAGYPGSPADWTRAGFADETAEAFASAHHGLAPLLVIPDTLGVDVNDTECVNSQLGQADSYLSIDVPNHMRSTFNAGRGEGSLAVAGFSAGGTCALMLALRHPDIFRTFGDYAGLTSPTVGGYVQPSLTIERLFDGSQAEYEKYDPLSLLKTMYRGLAGWFEVGTSDPDPEKAQQTLVPLARSAGILTCVAVAPGGQHDFDFAAQAFRDSLPWLAFRVDAGPQPRGVSCSS